MRIAVEGCSHGCLDQIYSTILSLDKKAKMKTTLLLLCGDVQTLRNQRDMHCLAVPDKHKQMGDFHRYYSGQRKAPILTIMIGGNHEASNYLWELYHGGWVAPNIYYLGAAGCVNVGGLTIAGISGIYKSHDYTLGRFESMPYTLSTVRSIYHTRQYDTFRLHLLARVTSQKPDIVMSHDWPNTIEQRGDVNWLKKKKAFFVDEINTSSLGSPPLWKLLKDLCPKFWFSAHLHVRFAALYKHSGKATQIRGGAQQAQASNISNASSKPEDSVDESVEARAINAEEMNIDMSDGEDITKEEIAANPEAIEVDEDDVDEDPSILEHSHAHKDSSSLAAGQDTVEISHEAGATRFLALSKCLIGQDFLQILDVPAPFDTQEDFQRKVPIVGEEVSADTLPSFQYNVPWLAVTKATHEYLSLEKRQQKLPDGTEFSSHVKEQEKWIKDRVAELQESNQSGLKVLDIEQTQQFVKTAPASSDQDGQLAGPPPWYTNPQTVALCSLLGIENKINPPPINSAPLPPFPGIATNGLTRRPILSEEEEIRKIEEAAQSAMKRKKMQKNVQEDEPIDIMTLEDDDNEVNSRWKEGSG